MRNNNTAIIKKITRRAMSADKKRNFFIIVAIILTTFMIATVFSIGISFIETQKKQQLALMGTTAHAAVTKPTVEQLEKMKGLSYIKEYGVGNHVAYVKSTPEMGDINLSLFTFDKTSWDKMRVPAYDDIVGRFPQKENEVMFPFWVFEQMGIDNPQIGMEIPLDYIVINGDEQISYSEKFILCGYFTSYMYIRSGNIDSIMVSKALSDKYGKTAETDGSATIIFDNSAKALEYCDRLEVDLAITEKQDVRPVPMYHISSSEQIKGIISFSLIALFLMLTGYLLIYNAMFISVSRDIRFYGMLKTIGTTPKQLSRIVTGQIIRLCAYAIPIGLLLAALLSLLIAPMLINNISTASVKASVSFSPIIYIGAALLSFITTLIGAAKPAKKAASISPIEAVRFSGIEMKDFKAHGFTNAKPHKMAFRNVFRDKKRAFVVLLSLTIGMTTFIAASTIVISMNIDNFVRSYMKNDFELNNNTANIANEEKKHKFTPEFLADLQEIPGFKDMQTMSETMGYIKYSEKYEPYLKAQFEHELLPEEMQNIKDLFSTIIVGIDPAFLEEYSKTLERPFDIAAFERGEFVLLSSNTPELLMEIEDIDFRTSSEKTPTKLKVGGTVPLFFAGTGYSVAPTIICSNTLLNKLYENPVIGKVSINVEKGFDVGALEAIKSLVGDDKEISRTSIIETREELKQVRISMFVFGGGIALIIGLIGVMNFINIISVGIMVRKRELAILESVGMSKKHMKKMLVWEGGWYAILTLTIVASLGSLANYGLFNLFKQQADYAIFSYPMVPVLIVSTIVTILCIFTPQRVYRSVSRSTLVERLRETE